jgi:acetoin utilization deacetylase AcuC-like enzyme
VLDAVDMSLDGRATRSFCAIRPPGHHALRDRAMGFCLFSNVALAAHYARARHGVDRVLIVDWDVHHGNGTQALVEQEPAIHFVSLHQWPWYPGTGPASDRGPHRTVWNIPMPPALESQRYVDALLAAIDSATDRFAPDLVFISAGFDSLRGDPLGGFTLEISDIDRLTRELCSRAAVWGGGRVIAALEGGYAPERVGAASLAVLKAMLDS